MDFGGFSSRGGHILNALEDEMFKIALVPGGKVVNLARKVCALIDRYESVWRPMQQVHPIKFGYIIAGIPDITELLRRPDTGRGHYEETIFREPVRQAISRVLGAYLEAEELIKNKGATPVFATIAPMDLGNWNYHRSIPTEKRDRKTCYLDYVTQYKDMQFNLNKVVMKLNDHINIINYRNRVKDLDLARDFMKEREQRRGRKRGSKIRTHAHLLPDGCHPSREIGRKWATRATLVHSANRKRHATPYELRIASTPRSVCDTMGRRRDGWGYI